MFTDSFASGHGSIQRTVSLCTRRSERKLFLVARDFFPEIRGHQTHEGPGGQTECPHAEDDPQFDLEMQHIHLARASCHFTAAVGPVAVAFIGT